MKLIKKTPLLKELTISEIIIALINQQQKQDRTSSLRQYLYKTKRPMFEDQQEAELIIILPDFAIQEMTQEQLFQYHLQKNNWAGDQYINYQNLLVSVNEKRKKIIDNSSNIFESSEKIMNELLQKLKESYNYVHQNRGPLHNLNQHLQGEYIRINKKILKVRNMQRALDVMRLWNKSNISKILNIKVENIENCQNVAELFDNFDQIVAFLAQNKHQLSNYSNLVALITNKKRGIVLKIYQNMLNSIIHYSNQSRYGIIYSQYMFILQKGFITNEQKGVISTQSILKQQRLCSIMQSNIHQMFFGVLNKKSQGFNIEMLNEDAYIDFFIQIMEEFSQYFNSWHKVTTFHIHKDTPYKQSFIKYRTTVYQKMLERISQSLKFSNKFSCLGVSTQLALIEKLSDFMQCGEQWMGKCTTNLPHVLLQRYRMQIQNFYKINNGELKSILLEQFSINVDIEERIKQDDKLIKQNDRLKAKLSRQDETISIIKQFTKLNIDMSKIEKLFYSKEVISKPAIKIDNLNEQSFRQELALYWEKLSTKTGFKLFKAIIEYQLREHYLPDNTQLYLICQHLQFLIIVLYKICLPGGSRQSLEKDIFNDSQRDQRISGVKAALAKGSIEETTLASINHLRHIFMDRRTYSDLYEFLSALGNKYDGISITTYINPALYFQNFEKYQGPIAQLNQKFLVVMNDLLTLVEYIEFAISKGRFYKSGEEVHMKVMRFKQVIPNVVLLYFTSYFEASMDKYQKQVLPLFINLKFDIKKLAADTLIYFKDYRNKIGQIYRANNIQKYSKNNRFHQMLFAKQVEYFYKFIIDLYSRIEKINDNGRQIVKSEQFQFSRLVGLQKSWNNGDNWLTLFDLFLELSKERSQKTILEKVDKIVLQFPIQWWKSNLMWIYSDFSSRQKKEYMLKLCNVYLNKLISLPKI